MCLRFQKSKSPWLHWSPSQSVVPNPMLHPTPAAPVPLCVQPPGHITPHRREPGNAPRRAAQTLAATISLPRWAAFCCKRLLTTYAPQAGSLVWNKVEGIVEGQLENAEHTTRWCSIFWEQCHAEVQHMLWNLGQVTHLLCASIPSNVG